MVTLLCTQSQRKAVTKTATTPPQNKALMLVTEPHLTLRRSHQLTSCRQAELLLWTQSHRKTVTHTAATSSQNKPLMLVTEPQLTFRGSHSVAFYYAHSRAELLLWTQCAIPHNLRSCNCCWHNHAITLLRTQPNSYECCYSHSCSYPLHHKLMLLLKRPQSNVVKHTA